MRWLTLSLASVLVPLASAQTTWYVDVNGTPPGSGTQGDPYTSIQFAITQPTTIDLDEIRVLPGTYFESIDYSGKSLRIASTDGAETTILDGQYLDTVVRVESGESTGTWLDGFTVTHGESDITHLGAAIRVVASGLSLNKCRIVANADQPGSGPVAGIFVEDGGIFIDQCDVSDNGSPGVWGAAGLHVTGTLPVNVTIFASRFENNLGGLGGAMFLGAGTALIKNTDIAGNRTNNEAGAGIYMDGGDVDLLGVRFLDNVNHFDSYPGGAIYQRNNALFAFECSFDNNEGQRGGALASDGGVAMIVGSRFTGNVALALIAGVGDGGAIFASNAASVELRDCLFVNNQAQGGCGCSDGRGGALFGPVVADRCTFYGNSAREEGGAASGATLVNCIVWRSGLVPLTSSTVATFSDVAGGFPGAGNIASDPQLLDPGYPEFHLRSTSPCINTGDPASPPDSDGSVADMGAFVFLSGYLPEPQTYCRSKTNSQGCAPQIGWSGTPTLSGADDFTVHALGVLGGQVGILVWGLAAAEQPLFGGTLCVGGFMRTPVISTGGTAGGVDCTGFPQFNFTHAYLTAMGVPPYETLYAQWWYRDPGFAAPQNFGLSNALKFIVMP